MYESCSVFRIKDISGHVDICYVKCFRLGYFILEIKSITIEENDSVRWKEVDTFECYIDFHVSTLDSGSNC